MMAQEWTHNGKTYRMTSGSEVRPEWIELACVKLTAEWQTTFSMRIGDHVLSEMVALGLAERKGGWMNGGCAVYRAA